MREGVDGRGKGGKTHSFFFSPPSLSSFSSPPPPLLRKQHQGKSHSLPDRIDSLCARAINWAKLATKPKHDKKLAVTVFSFPPDKGNVGTAAYLNVFGSIAKVLEDLRNDGYDVGDAPLDASALPAKPDGTAMATSEALMKSVLDDTEARYNSADMNVAYRMTVEEYQRLCPYAEALEENWGELVGGVFFLLLLSCLKFFWAFFRRRRTRKNRRNSPSF